MKTFKFLLCTLILFFALSCKKENDQPVNFKALKNGSYWAPEHYLAAYSLGEKQFIIRCENGVEGNGENLFLRFDAIDLSGPVSYNQFYSMFFNMVGGDMLYNFYCITPDPINIIQITSFDTIAKKITGTFNIKLSQDQKPDILFTRGFFSIPYREENTFLPPIRPESEVPEGIEYPQE